MTLRCSRRRVHPKATNALRPKLREMLEEIWSAVGPRGSAEFVTEVAARLPSMAIAELLGLPGEAERMAEYSASLQAVFALDLATERRAATETAYFEVYDYVHGVVQQPRADSGDDLVSTLVALEEAGDRLSEEEVVTLVTSVIAGGTDTTQAQLSHGMRLFVEHPEQWALLAERPELAASAANEVLRFEPITPFTARLAVDALDYRGVTFPPDTVPSAAQPRPTATRAPSPTRSASTSPPTGGPPRCSRSGSAPTSASV